MSIDFRNCDYKELIKDIKPESIDLLLTDPPYCVSRTYQLGFSNMGRSGMDYGEWDYNFNQKEWIGLCAPLVRKGGSIIIFNDWKNMAYLVEELEKNGFIIKDLLRWEKANPMPRNVNSRYVMDNEYAVWAVKGKAKWTFNKPNDVPYLRPVFKSGIVLGKNRIHPTQKQLSVIEEIIKIHTKENETVLDVFAGSAVVGLACKNLNRNFIGCEIEKEYYDKAVKTL